MGSGFGTSIGVQSFSKLELSPAVGDQHIQEMSFMRNRFHGRSVRQFYRLKPFSLLCERTGKMPEKNVGTFSARQVPALHLVA